MSTDLHKRLARLENTHAVGMLLLPLMSDVVQDWFENAEAALARAMIDAAPTDDDARRSAALQAWALRELRSYIRKTVDAGQRAPDEIAKLRKRNDE